MTPANAGRTVAIGLPVYNGADFVEEALRSLMEQTHRDILIFISDNASTDSTGEICRRLAAEDPRLRYFRQPETLKISLNFDFVLQKAEGDFFMWVGHDDIWHPQFIEKVLTRLIGRDAGVAFTNFDLIDRDRRTVAHYDLTRLESRPSPRAIWRFIREPDYMGKANPMYGIFPLRDLRRGYDAFLIKYTNVYGHDMSFVFQMLVKKGIAIVPETLFRKRIPDHQVHGRFLERIDPYQNVLSQRPRPYLRHLWLYVQIGRKFGYPFSSLFAVGVTVAEFFYLKVVAKIRFLRRRGLAE